MPGYKNLNILFMKAELKPIPIWCLDVLKSVLRDRLHCESMDFLSGSTDPWILSEKKGWTLLWGQEVLLSPREEARVGTSLMLVWFARMVANYPIIGVWSRVGSWQAWPGSPLLPALGPCCHPDWKSGFDCCIFGGCDAGGWGAGALLWITWRGWGKAVAMGGGLGWTLDTS